MTLDIHDEIVLLSDGYTAKISTKGAELISFRNTVGLEYIWTADTDVWARHAPILFPAIGKFSNNGAYTHAGIEYVMPQHGFARDMTFSIQSQTDDSVTLELRSSDTSRAIYPFNFVLTVSYHLSRHVLSSSILVKNTNNSVLPCAIGFHPGFLLEKDELYITSVEFSKHEGSVCRHIASGLLTDEYFKSPLVNRVMEIDKDTFISDAYVFPQPQSHGVLITSPTRTIAFQWSEESNNLTLWSKPEAPFICIEPWIGAPDESESSQEILEKQNLVHVGTSQTLEWSMTLE